MSKDVKNPAVDDDDEPDTGLDDGDDGADDGDGKELGKWKVLSRKHETEAKKLRRQVDELQRQVAAGADKDKSEIEKLSDRLAAAEARAEKAELAAARSEVAAAKGIKPQHMKYLTGADRDELEDSADGILEDFPEAYAKGGGKTTSDTDGRDEGDRSKSKASGRPKERMRSGAAPDHEPEETNPMKVVEDLPRL